MHHTVSPPLRELVEALFGAAKHELIRELGHVTYRDYPALGTTPDHILNADGFIWVTPANFGYMSGALKHMFDTCFYPCLGALDGKPSGLVVHGNDDVTGAVASVKKLSSAWGLKLVGQPVEVTNGVSSEIRADAEELAVMIGLAAAGELPS